MVGGRILRVTIRQPHVRPLDCKTIFLARCKAMPKESLASSCLPVRPTLGSHKTSASKARIFAKINFGYFFTKIRRRIHSFV